MVYEQENHSSDNAKEAEIVWRNSMLRIAILIGVWFLSVIVQNGFCEC